VELSAELMAKLEQRARQTLRTPEEHAADLLREALIAPLFSASNL